MCFTEIHNWYLDLDIVFLGDMKKIFRVRIYKVSQNSHKSLDSYDYVNEFYFW